MASSSGQAKAQQLNAKLEMAARDMLDQMDKQHIRKIARKTYSCVVGCYDKAGASGSAESLDHCAQACQAPHQQANAIVQNEINQFQNRLNRSMQECQDKARDLMQPGYENDARKMEKVEQALLSCISQTVDSHIKLLKPMKDRILANIK